MRRFMICSGYVAKAKTPIPQSDFYDVWFENTQKAQPTQMFIAGAVGAKPMFPHGQVEERTTTQFFNGLGDLGHIRDKHEGRINYPFTGWAGGMMLGAMAAYNECLDFIYKEQDCLAFGPWVERLYKDKADGVAALGRGLKPPHHKLMSSQSLFLVEHRAIPTFVARYIAAGEDEAMGPNTGENKFRRMISQWPGAYRVQSGWNHDRDRPIHYKAEVWAAQQFTPDEFESLKLFGLI